MAISSMTGFASFDGRTGDSVWRWDLKSVNARGLDLRFRLPPGTESLEPALRKSVQSVLRRGSVTIALSTRFQGSVSRTSLNDDALSRAVEQITAIRARMDQDGIPVAPVHAETLLSMPGVITTDGSGEPEDTRTMNSDMIAGFDVALKALAKERRAEGERLARVISEQVTQIESLARDAAARASEAVLALRERLQTQLTTLLSDTALSPERMEQESALLASKADIREEIDRLHAHVAAARVLLASNDPVGRRIDFLTQEFNREANTLCSKSPTDALTRIGLDLKTVIDQMKEQAANVE